MEQTNSCQRGEILGDLMKKGEGIKQKQKQNIEWGLFRKFTAM